MKFVQKDLENQTKMKLQTFAAIIFCIATASSNPNDMKWKKPGCHKVGHKRDIKIEGCSQFTLYSNACRGFCESYAVPAPPELMGLMKINITSIGQCEYLWIWLFFLSNKRTAFLVRRLMSWTMGKWGGRRGIQDFMGKYSPKYKNFFWFKVVSLKK